MESTVDRRAGALRTFLRTEAAGGALLLAATAIAAKKPSVGLQPNPKKLNPPPGVVVPAAVKAELSAGTAALGKEIEKRAIALGNAQVRVFDWRDSNVQFFNALEVERNVMFLILTMIILVAALNIISGLIMLVKDKSGDIAILRTMGASQGAIMRVFFIAGASIGTLGTLAGVVIGLLFCANIEAIRQFITKVTGAELFNIIVCAATLFDRLAPL